MRRLDRVLDDLTHAADGRRRLPVVGQADAEAICGLFHAQVDRGAAARADAVAAAGRAIACAPGCAACCAALPAVFAGEAITIARWLRRPAHAAARAGFLARYGAWRAALADLLDAWAAAAQAGDVEAGAALAREAARRAVPCAFLDGGRCTIYPVRPAICRDHHALDTSASCAPGAPGEVAQASFPPLEAYLERIRPVVLALHEALRPDQRGARPVCEAVHAELAASRRGAPRVR